MITGADLLVIVLIAAGCSLAVAGLGALLLHLLRRRSVVLSLAVVMAIALGAVVAGALGTASAMFLSGHDLQVLLVVVAVAGPIGVLAAALLGRQVVLGSRTLRLAVRDLGEGAYVGSAAPLSAELAALDRQLRETSDRLAQSREREQALESSRRELVAWVSHDLRTPLAGIRAMAEALEDGVAADPATIARYYTGIREESDRLAGMVNDLLELSRINASALHLTLEEVPLADLVSDALASAGPVAAAKGVRLVGEAAPDLPAVPASAPELGRVLRNLLANAIRHTPPGGLVQVLARNGGGTAVIEVADECGGIPPDDLPRLFDVAFRGTTARTPGDDGGAGLGLAIARGLVEAHHGEITIGNFGRGCQVLVRLPAVNGNGQATTTPAPPRQAEA